MSGLRDPEEEAEVQAWIEQVIGEKFPPGEIKVLRRADRLYYFANTCLSALGFTLAWNSMWHGINWLLLNNSEL